MECIFCKIVKKEIPTYVIYEDGDILSFLDIEPINEGHVLIIPKDHYLDSDELPTELLAKITALSARIVAAIKRVYNPDGYSIMQNGGEFNDIGHYHLHIFPRYKEDGFSWNFPDKVQEYNNDIADRIRELL